MIPPVECEVCGRKASPARAAAWKWIPVAGIEKPACTDACVDELLDRRAAFDHVFAPPPLSPPVEPFPPFAIWQPHSFIDLGAATDDWCDCPSDACRGIGPDEQGCSYCWGKDSDEACPRSGLYNDERDVPESHRSELRFAIGEAFDRANPPPSWWRRALVAILTRLHPEERPNP